MSERIKQPLHDRMPRIVGCILLTAATYSEFAPLPTRSGVLLAGTGLGVVLYSRRLQHNHQRAQEQAQLTPESAL